MILNKNVVIDILLWPEFLCSSVIWELSPCENGHHIKKLLEHEDIEITDNLRFKLNKLIELNNSSFDDNYPPDSGFKTLGDVRYYLYYKLYVATLLSQEYKKGNVLLYGNDKNPINIEEYIKYLSTLTDEDLKSWLRPDLQ